MLKIHRLLVLICFLLSSYVSADETIFQLKMEENSFFPRVGNLQIIVPSVDSSPFSASPDLAFIDSGVKIDAQWESICSSNVRLAGGELTGWLLGPLFEGTFPGLEVNNTHDLFRASFGLGAGNVATTLYVVLAGSTVEFADAGSAKRFSCSGGIDVAEFAILYIFLWPDATTFADKGFYVGDVFYLTEIGLQHYFVYNSVRLF